MPGIPAKEFPSGTSTAVGPSFFVGQSTEVASNHSSRSTANILRRLGWVTAGAAALFVVATLEWQTWHPASTSRAREPVTVAQESAHAAGHAESPVPSPPVTAAPAKPRATTTPATTAEPLTPVALAVAPPPAPDRKPEVAQTEPPAAGEANDDSAKVRLLRAEMVRGDADAPITLANMYLEGKDVSRSCDEALNLLESAAAKNNARARNRLAALYEIGTCVQRDRVQAYRWLNAALAADRNNSWAQQNRDQTWREMTSEERTMAQAYR